MKLPSHHSVFVLDLDEKFIMEVKGKATSSTFEFSRGSCEDDWKMLDAFD